MSVRPGTSQTTASPSRSAALARAGDRTPARITRGGAWLLLAAAALAGCAGTSRVMLGSARPPVDPASVRVYATPPAGSVEIAQLESTSAVGFGTQGQTDAAVARLKREAAALGANGVVLMGVGSSASPLGVSVGGGSFGRSSAVGGSVGIPTTQRSAAGIAIYVPAGSVPEETP